MAVSVLGVLIEAKYGYVRISMAMILGRITSYDSIFFSWEESHLQMWIRMSFFVMNFNHKGPVPRNRIKLN